MILKLIEYSKIMLIVKPKKLQLQLKNDTNNQKISKLYTIKLKKK